MVENESCLVCSHVLADVEKTAFVCHSSNGWVAACSEKCLDEHDEEKFGMIHLKHVLSAKSVDPSVRMLPKCFASDRKGQTWYERYFLEDYDPEEGDFVAPHDRSELLNLDLKAEFFVYLQEGIENGVEPVEIVWVQLDEGTVCVPFWNTEFDALKFRGHLSGNERCERVTYEELVNLAKISGIKYLAVDFLVMSFDYALLVPRS